MVNTSAFHSPELGKSNCPSNSSQVHLSSRSLRSTQFPPDSYQPIQQPPPQQQQSRQQAEQPSEEQVYFL